MGGFSLIEAAIVLALAGLVIGGLWVAASAVRQSMVVSKTQTAVMQIIENWRRLYRDTDIQGVIDATAYGIYWTGDPTLFKGVEGVTYNTMWNIDFSGYGGTTFGGLYGIEDPSFCGGNAPCEVMDMQISPPTLAICERVLRFFMNNQQRFGIARMGTTDCTTYGLYISLKFNKRP